MFFVIWVGWARQWNISKEKEGFSCFITSFITSLIFCWIKSYVTVSGGRKGYCLSVQSAFSTHQQHLDKYHLMQILYRFFNLNFIKCKERLLPWRWISKSSKEKSQNTACSVILMSPVIIYTTLIQWLRPTEQSQLLYWYASKHPTLKVASEWMHNYWNVNFLRRSSHGHKKQAVVFAWILILIVLWW